jgi:hypothetical protein
MNQDKKGISIKEYFKTIFPGWFNSTILVIFIIIFSFIKLLLTIIMLAILINTVNRIFPGWFYSARNTSNTILVILIITVLFLINLALITGLSYIKIYIIFRDYDIKTKINGLLILVGFFYLVRFIGYSLIYLVNNNLQISPIIATLLL